MNTLVQKHTNRHKHTHSLAPSAGTLRNINPGRTFLIKETIKGLDGNVKKNLKQPTTNCTCGSKWAYLAERGVMSLDKKKKQGKACQIDECSRFTAKLKEREGEDSLKWLPRCPVTHLTLIGRERSRGQGKSSHILLSPSPIYLPCLHPAVWLPEHSFVWACPPASHPSLRWTHNFNLLALVVLIIVSVSSFRCLRSEGNPRPCLSSLSEPPRVFFWMAVSAHSLAHCTIELPLELPGECLSQQLHWQLFSKVHLIYLI